MARTSSRRSSGKVVPTSVPDEVTEAHTSQDEATRRASAAIPPINAKAFDYSNEQYVTDVTVDFLYTPHSMTALLVSAMLMIALAFSEAESSFDAARRGVSGVAMTIIMLGLLVFPSGPFIRPHPAFWRIVFGASVSYVLFLVYLLCQNRDDARALLTLFDDELYRPPVWRPYADNCSFTVDNLLNAINDRFFVAHFVGWVLKSLLVRNRAVCWFSSILWEILEISFVHMMPNFAECWWDSLFLDILLCNGLGIEVGHRLCQYLEVQQYHWIGIKETPTVSGKAKRVLMQFSPERWTTVTWKFTKNWRRFLTLQLLLVCFQIKDLNAFFLKHILWIPSEHNLNLYRLIILFFISLPSIRQIYIYMSDKKCKRLGSQALVWLLIMWCELLIVVKFGQGEFPASVPAHVKLMWSILFPLYLCGCLFVLVRAKVRKNRKKSSDRRHNKED